MTLEELESQIYISDKKSKNCSSIVKLLSILTPLGAAAGALGGWFLSINTHWYHKPEKENFENMQQLFLIGGAIAGSITTVVGIGLNQFIKNNSNGTDTKNISLRDKNINIITNSIVISDNDSNPAIPFNRDGSNILDKNANISCDETIDTLGKYVIS